jgi:hypothetical protein
LFPQTYQVLALVIINSPELDAYTNIVIYCAVSRRLLAVPIRLNPHIHPVQGDIIALGDSLHHIYRAGSDTREEQLPGAWLFTTGVIRNEVVVASVADGPAMSARAVGTHFVG